MALGQTHQNVVAGPHNVIAIITSALTIHIVTIGAYSYYRHVYTCYYT